MSIATITATPSTVATVDAATVPTVDECRAAFNAVNATGSVSEVATATLAALTLARYSDLANRLARNVDGVRALLSDDRARVAKSMWLDITGAEAPSKANGIFRSPAHVSVQQYISRYGTVAANLDFGVEWLADVATAKEGYSQISEGSSDAKRAQEDRIFSLFVTGLPKDDRAAFDKVESIMHAHGSEHYAAFTRVMKVTK